MPKEKLGKVGKFLAHSQGSVCSASLSHNGQLLGTGGEDKKIHIWSTERASCILSLTAHKSAVEAIRFNNNSCKLASGSRSGSVKVWDLQNIREVRELSGHKARVTNLDFLPLGDFVGSASQDAAVKIWDVRRRGCIRTLIGHEGPVNTLRFSPDGKWVASAGDDGIVKLWDIPTGKELTAFSSQTGPLVWVQFHRSLLMLVTASVNGTFQIYDLENFVAVGKSPRPANGQIFWAIFHPDSPVLYSASADGVEICAYEPASQELESVVLASDWRDLHHSDAVFDVADEQIVCAGRQPDSGMVSTFMLNVRSCAPFAETARPLTQSSGRRSFKEPLKGELQAGGDEEKDSGNDDAVDPREQKIVDDSEYQRFFRPQAAPEPREQRPSNNHAVLQDFLPRGEKPSPSPAAAAPDDFRTLRQPHDAFVVSMSSRYKNLQMMRSLWARSGPKLAMETACQLGDPSVTVDLLNLLQEKPKIWSLDLATVVLPHLTLLVQSKYTTHVESACQALRLILKNFAEVIRANVAASPEDPCLGRVVDLNREDRYRKCRACYSDLKAAGNVLERVSSNSRVPIAGAREVLMMLRQLD